VPNTNAQTCFGITSKQCGDNFGRIRNKTTITDLHFHDTRHEAITRLSKKMPILALARNVGHTDIKQLMVYYNESASEIAKLLD
jgi:integrase